LSVDVAELEEFAGKSYRIDPDGTVSLPLIGRIPAAGLTLGQLEADITKRLYDQVKEPHVSAAVAESRSQPVSVLGSVNTPGVYQLQGGKRLFDVLSMAGGLKPDAGTTLRITRVQSAGPLPVPGAQEDQERKVNTAEINLRELVDGRNSSLNITVAPRDTISVPRADLVYVLGEVRKAGGFTISKKQVSALQALSMAEGLMPTAEPKKARVLRFVEGQDSRQEIPVNLKKLLAGSGGDVQLRPDDILFIPSNTAHRISVRAVEMAVTTLSGIIIWHGI
jgi:polysaccharide export outer membrane protein